MWATLGRAGLVVAVTVGLWTGNAGAINVTVNQNTQYQTIDGFGMMINAAGAVLHYG